ncbi:unnamed protein product [Durusdinium trenchii]|uniref:Uncharacterized protein n=1 Tax=Durusdinium trenchii TaxID=1381693 RepID=A0ABP0LI09_9DINO
MRTFLLVCSLAWAAERPERHLQGFYEQDDTAERMQCPNYLPVGVVRSESDKQPRECTRCSVLPWARQASHEEICRLDVSNCSVLKPGERCWIRCREPYFEGEPVHVMCNNSEESGGGLAWDRKTPKCKMKCPNLFGGPPDGYEEKNGMWQCAPGYIGKAEYLCTLHDDCVARPSWSGCTKEVHCMAPFDVDLCMLNLSTCYMVMGGKSCKMGCNSPQWAGTPTLATCKEKNVDPFTPLDWTMPVCEPSCPPGTPVPEGYVLNSNGEWRCAETHYGTPQALCAINEQCVSEWRPSGCLPMHPCVAPDDDLCRYNMSDCLEVPPGGSCVIRCREPFVGGASLATCQANNIDPNQELTWSPPRPSCALLLCPEVELIPEGYERHADGWRCAPGFVGDAKAFCDVDAVCTPQTVLSGCLRKLPCWPLEVDECMMDASDCAVQPGQSCFVRCKAPYLGSPGIARCPDDNTDPWALVSWTDELPNCTLLTCPDPVKVPRSYARTPDGWSCAPGYAGRAEVLCRHGPNCEPSPGELAGCGNPSACVAPTTLSCSVNMSECSVVLPGQSCHVQCASPFQGDPTLAVCPFDNLDPAGLRWRPPDCVQFCPDPEISSLPPGYIKTGAGWACTRGFQGAAQKVCGMDERCVATATVMEGCFEEVPCANLPQQAACGFDVSECQAVPSGGNCEVRCKAPFFVGPSSQAFCPEANTNPNQMLTWAAQECNMECPPAESTTGYVWSEYGWICAPGWTGTVEVVCSMENCDVSPSTLTGCVRLQRCTVPEANPCLYVFDCGNEGPGESCMVRCRPPYVGQATVAQCPSGNTQVQPLEWTPPDCECPDPSPVPEGYLKSESGWHCAPGFVGQAVKSCNSTRSCFNAPNLWGCAKVHGCLPLELDNCEFDFSNCSDVASGESCEIKCNLPYVSVDGSMGYANCPAENVDRFQMMTWTLPKCRLDCPEVSPVPIAYQRVNASWVCAPGYAGTVQVDCYLSSYCSSTAFLEGCNEEEPCFPIELDRCVFEHTCAGDQCRVGCKAPYQGLAQSSSCPQGNVVPKLWPTFGLPQCSIPDGCVDPLPMPLGYVKTATGWRCAEGYSGLVHVACDLGDQCEQLQPILTGCSLIRPCKMPAVDMCIFDLSACGDKSVPHGTNCTARCRLPYNGTVTAAFCPEGNTDPDQVLIWAQPQCELIDCLDPMPVPPGYTKLAEGGWSCADGYAGVVDGCCQFDGICKPRLSLSGCYAIGPCAMPSPDTCQFDLNDCPTTPLGYSCSIRCQFPYEGTATVANCSEGAGAPPMSERSLKLPAPRCSPSASDPLWLPQQLYYELPGCFCPDPFVTPDGYEKNGTTWQCAKGYAGEAQLLCQDGQVCLAEPTLRGCSALQPCKEPELEPENACRYDYSDCVQYPPKAGETCIIRCRDPYVGTFGFAGCPADNTVFNRSSIWLDGVPKPDCTLNCPDPSDVPFGFIYIMPEGYMKDAADNWMCAEGYAGNVRYACSFGPNCTLINEPAGCLPFAPCAGMTTTTALDNCSLDTILCEGIGPGVACNIHCRPPYVGPPGEGCWFLRLLRTSTASSGWQCEAICPENNTDPTTEVQWVYMPGCYCPDTCQEEEGYLKIIADPSIYFRRLFHLGAADVAGPFQCADGYLGAAHLECRKNDECFDSVQLFGCDEIKGCIMPTVSRETMALNYTESPFQAEVPAAEAEFAAVNPGAVVPWVPDAEDFIPEYCMYDVSDCHGVEVGGTCKVSCLWPLREAGGFGGASCPDMNTERDRVVDWIKPMCVLGDCVDPNPLPEGMEKTHEGYRCALGYAGEISFQCFPSSVKEGCGTRAMPQGCQKMQSCSVPQADVCSHDVSDCENVPTGGYCTVRCKYPFSGFSNVGRCARTK